MKILVPNPENIAAAADALRAGDLVGMPTETVYGLAGDANSAAAIAKIYATKNRPANNPLIIHVVNATAAQQLGELNAAAGALAAVFWPGPLTLVAPKLEGRGEKVEGYNLSSTFYSLPSIALRVPSHPVAQALLRAFGGPIAAPSANLSGQLSPTQANHVANAFKGLDQPKIILAGGRAETGLESTIVDCTGDTPKILRPGSITLEQLRAVVADTIGFAPQKLSENETPIAPGQFEKHYAPRTKLRLNAAEVFADEAVLAFGIEPLWTRRAKFMLNLSPSGDLAEAARNLFSHLHQLDAQNAAAIAVMPVPNEGIGIAINDRLSRGAIRS
jgi:L-threonylcarbamoyladenylate synthase